MFFKKLFKYLTCANLKSKRCLNVKSLTYYFHMKTKILTEFQICISVSLTVYGFVWPCKWIYTYYASGGALYLRNICKASCSVLWDLWKYHKVVVKHMRDIKLNLHDLYAIVNIEIFNCKQLHESFCLCVFFSLSYMSRVVNLFCIISLTADDIVRYK